MQGPIQKLEDLLDKYHDNTATPEERLLLEKWYEQLNVSASPVKKLYGSKTAFKFLNIAAVLLIGVGLAWMTGVLRPRKSSHIDQLSYYYSPQPVDTPQKKTIDQEQIITTTGTARIRKLVLPDGSAAWLNKRSVLKYPSNFSNNERVVEVVKGEVFFDVVPNASAPFKVRTGLVNTTVLGTSFIVKQSFRKNTVEIAVRSGKVKVEKFNSRGASALIGRHLLPGDKLSFDTTANTYYTDYISTNEIGAFIKGKLVYEDATMEEIIHDINRKYNINIIFANSELKQCHYHIAFDDLSLNDCLQVLSTLTNTKIEKLDKRHYKISGDLCN